MDHICEHCKHSFSSKSNLATHKRSAKYCIQGRLISSVKHKCLECGKEFTRNSTLRAHIPLCRVKIVREQQEEVKILREYKTYAFAKIKELKEQVEDLKLLLAEDHGQIKVYKERPGVINNNQYVHPKLVNIKCDTISPLTIEHVKQEVNQGKYSYENYIRGEKGLVEFISSLITDDDQRSYVCTDTSRNKFHRLIETREWKEDNGAGFLNNIFDQLKEPATDYYKKVVKMAHSPDEQDTGDFLMDKTKRMFFGITCPQSKDRDDLFNRIRTEVRHLAAI